MIAPEPSFDRLRAAIVRDRLPDRVPMAEGGVDVNIMEAFLGRPIDGLKTYAEFWRQAGYDYVILQVRGQPLADSAQIAISEGRLRAHRQASESTGAVGQVVDWRAFEAYPWIDMNGVYLKDVDEMERCLPDGMKIIVNVGPIFSGTWRCMGLETFSLACGEQPDLVKAVVDKMGDLTVRIVDAVAGRDSVGGIWLGDDMAYTSGLMASPAFFRSHIFPHYRRIGDVCRRYDKIYINHSDGDRSAVIEDLIGCGIQALHPNEPTSVDIFELKHRWGKRVSFIGNVDVDLLARGTPEQVKKYVKYLIDNVAPGGGFALSSGNSVTGDVPLANYKAMIETTLQYGAIY